MKTDKSKIVSCSESRCALPLNRFKIFNITVKMYTALNELNSIQLKNVIEHLNFR